MSTDNTIHIFKNPDGTHVFSGTVPPSNMMPGSGNYVEGKLPEGETWDKGYTYTCVDGVMTKGAKLPDPSDPPT